MRLYFLRHATAEERRPGLEDEDRRLTPEGTEEERGVGRGARALGLRFDAILTSPLVRARETAEIAARELDVGDRQREEPLLASGCGPGELARALQEQPPEARILLVGHEPDFSVLIAALIGGGTVRMKKAALACVDWPGGGFGSGELRWLLNQEHLRRLER